MARRDTRALVAHLFRRAGFGLRPDELDHYTTLGVQASVDYLTSYGNTADPAETAYPPPDLAAINQEILHDIRKKLTTNVIKDYVQALSKGKLQLQEWWIHRMLTTNRPLQEKMTLFWHGHFATGIFKAYPYFMLEQNQLFRSMALGNFNHMLKAVNQDVAMLLWLDGFQNRKGKPNENFSRELMELFTIGVGHFSEHDVREGARALTGWTINPATFQAIFLPALHDDGVKTYLGHTGNLGADDVMDILAAHPHAGPFLVRKLFSYFAYDNADAATIQPFVDTYYRSGYEIKAVLREILLSDAFYADAAFQQRISSPAEFVAGSVRELGAAVPVLYMTYFMALMGMDLFDPPNVGGWPGGITWIDAAGLVERFNFAGLLSARFGAAANFLNATNLVRQSGARDSAGLVDYLLARLIGVGAAPATRQALLDYVGGPGPLATLDEARIRGLVHLVLSTPEYQLN